MSKKRMTLNELLLLNKRLNSIKKSDKDIKNKRLRSLLFDVDYAFDVDNDVRAYRFYWRVGEELSESLKGA